MTSVTAIDERDDERGSDPPEDDGRPSCVVAMPTSKPPRPPCVWCGREGSRRRRRRLCIACVRKFRECGTPLPPVAVASPPGPPRGSLPPPPPTDPLLWLLERMTVEQRDKALAYLGELAGRPEPHPKP